MPELTYIQAISDGLRQEMRRNRRVFSNGEDVGVSHGGVFKVTQGFQEEFGPWRVIDAPLCRDGDRRRLHRRGDDLGMRPVAEGIADSLSWFPAFGTTW